MGYTFRVGNAVPFFSKSSFPELEAKWEVEGKFLPEAPFFPNDGSEHTNDRSPSYSDWSDFCKLTGLYDFFYNSYGHLHAGHPGCIGIRQKDLDLVEKALERYQKIATKLPGFDDDDFDDRQESQYDGNLARLMWLHWWMKWAIENCETPAIQNT